MDGFETDIRIYPGYDHRDELSGRRGAHPLTIDFILRGPNGAVNWTLNTGWVRRPLAGPFRPGTVQERREEPGTDARLWDCSPRAGAVSSHVSEKREDYYLGPNPCPILGGECYGDTGYTIGDEVLEAMFESGHDGIWAKLRELYDEWIPGE